MVHHFWINIFDRDTDTLADCVVVVSDGDDIVSATDIFTIWCSDHGFNSDDYYWEFAHDL